MKEEYAIILDYLPNGYPLDKRRLPIAQAVGENAFTLLELIPKKDAKLQIGERVYIGNEKRDKIYYISGRLKREKITESAKERLSEFISEKVEKDKENLIKFFNEAYAINKRMHSLELLPGFGKKHMLEIIKQRKEKPFESFEDIKERISNIPDPKRAIEKRILKELTEFERYNLFIN